jgi:hypothetical protein
MAYSKKTINKIKAYLAKKKRNDAKRTDKKDTDNGNKSRTC